jgi:tetratricopeptide (TPR) repeat protein
MFKKSSAAVALACTGFGLAFATAAYAQDTDIPVEQQCLRYLQSYERGLHIPQGLLTAISMTEAGRPDAAGHLTPWPWTINVGGQGRFFETKDEAVAATRKLIDEGQNSIDIGCMQVNTRYHPDAFRSIEDAFDPATNVAYGAKFLSSLHGIQGSWAKAIERYHTSEDGKREEYRDRVLAIWNGDARAIVMDAVLAEQTDTPYHHAMNDFAAGDYTAAFAKYQDILKSNPKDRLGLLGIAMCDEKLGAADTEEAYANYLAADPDNESVLNRVIQKAKALPGPQALARLETLSQNGVDRPELMSAIAEVASNQQKYDVAFKYAAAAAEKNPDVLMYVLNAAILADRTKQTTVAVRLYEDFLEEFTHRPVVLETSIDGIRDRVRYLRARL